MDSAHPGKTGTRLARLVFTSLLVGLLVGSAFFASAFLTEDAWRTKLQTGRRAEKQSAQYWQGVRARAIFAGLGAATLVMVGGSLTLALPRRKPELPQQSQRFRTAYVWTVCAIAALGGLMFGYDWIVISGTKPFYQRQFDLQTASEEGWAMASALVGCLIGAVLAGGLSDRFGRKRLLVLSALGFVVSSLGTALAGAFVAFNAWRVAGGVAIGLASILAPMYIAELAPAPSRGKLVAMNQLAIVVGILLAQAANWGIAGFGALVDQHTAAEWLAEQPAPLDATEVAKELAWQLSPKDRPTLREQFAALAERRGGALDAKRLDQMVRELNARRKNAGQKEVKFDPAAVELAGRGLLSWNVAEGWRWMFGVTALPASCFLLLMFFVPESPRWLVKAGKAPPARGVLARIGGSDYAEQELPSIQQALAGASQRVHLRELFQGRMAPILALGVALAVLQQWCGINVIFYYAADLFQAAGYSVSDALLNIVFIGAVNLLFTLFALASVDWCGRRVLLLVGFAGLAVIHALIGASFFAGTRGLHVLLLTLAAIGCYAVSLAPVTWVVLSEIFPNRVRGAAMSVSVFALWTACFLLTFTFPHLSQGVGMATTFWIYAAICAVGWVFTWFRLPETRGKTLEQLQRELVE